DTQIHARIPILIRVKKKKKKKKKSQFFQKKKCRYRKQPKELISDKSATSVMKSTAETQSIKNDDKQLDKDEQIFYLQKLVKELKGEWVDLECGKEMEKVPATSLSDTERPKEEQSDAHQTAMEIKSSETRTDSERELEELLRVRSQCLEMQQTIEKLKLENSKLLKEKSELSKEGAILKLQCRQLKEAYEDDKKLASMKLIDFAFNDSPKMARTPVNSNQENVRIDNDIKNEKMVAMLDKCRTTRSRQAIGSLSRRQPQQRF
ncbi:hypothetical protein RFI_23958, partial [Reticulomyxa filosa]